MIVVDAGHGGEDPGAIGNGIIEKDLNLSISQYMERRFNELGIPVEMTRDTDETLSPTERVNRALNAFGATPNIIVISNHINAGGGDGAEVIYPLRSNSVLPNLILSEIAKTGQNVRRAYQRRLPSDPSQDYYFMQRNTAPTQAITVEYGFLDSTADDVFQLKNFSDEYAEAVVKAVAEYLRVPYMPPEGANVYVVQSGDSLWSVARKLNMSVEELKAANNLTNNMLAIGQILKIPKMEPPPVIGEYIIYDVKPGDSLYAIAKQYNMTVDELINYNNFSTSSLKVGQQILIPSASAIPPVEQPSADYLTYRVQPGDSLYSIARKYNTTVDELMRINNLSNNLLSVGQEIRIQVNQTIEQEIKSPNYVEYIVRSGDNLYTIAKRYNTTVGEIQKYNNLKTNNLSIGQILKIPVSKTPITYVVKSGDNLYAIAREYNTTVDTIKRKNNLTTNSLSIGQILII